MNRFSLHVAIAALAALTSVAATGADAQTRRTATAQSRTITPTCEARCERQADQRACVSACYRDNYRAQSARATSRRKAIADLNDEAYEADVRRNPYLSAEAKNAILAQKANNYEDFLIPNDGPGAAVIDDSQPTLTIIPMRLAAVRYGTGAGTIARECGPGPCQLTKLYDLPAQWLTLSYRLTGISVDELYEHIDGVGLRYFEFHINGVKLIQGESVIHGDNYLAIALEEPCYYGGEETDLGCMIVSIDPDLFFPAYPPYPVWTVETHLLTTKPQIGPTNPVKPVEPPVLQRRIPRPRPQPQRRQGALHPGLMLAAAPGGARPGTQPQDQRAIEATPDAITATPPGQSAFPPRDDAVITSYIVPPAKITSYWLETIGETVSSERCTSCHAMDTPAKIHDHHNGIEGNITLVPSALISGQQIHSCQNCHACGPQKCTGGYLGNFGENRWATPTQAQNINWAALINANPQNWPAVVCQRMKSSLTTPQLRDEHFHEDFRLFWAVADGYVIGPGGGQLETAPPHSYSAFLERFDIWNDNGARCPPG